MHVTLKVGVSNLQACMVRLHPLVELCGFWFPFFHLLLFVVAIMIDVSAKSTFSFVLSFKASGLFKIVGSKIVKNAYSCFVAKGFMATTQRNKLHLLYFSRMAWQRRFRQRNCCRALANWENALPCDSSNVLQSCRDWSECKEMTWLKLKT